MQNKIRIAIVDDHQIVIDGIKALLDGVDNFFIALAYTSPKALLEAMLKTEIDILITDVSMPEMNGRELAKKVRASFPNVRILALSMSGEGATINAMIQESDIMGYVLKNISREELAMAIKKIASGGIYFPDDVLREMEINHPVPQDEAPVLTLREIEIIRLIEKEYSNKEIAAALFISERTVETHRKNILRKTGKNSVVGLLKYAYDHKLL